MRKYVRALLSEWEQATAADPTKRLRFCETAAAALQRVDDASKKAARQRASPPTTPLSPAEAEGDGAVPAAEAAAQGGARVGLGSVWGPVSRGNDVSALLEASKRLVGAKRDRPTEAGEDTALRSVSPQPSSALRVPTLAPGSVPQPQPTAPTFDASVLDDAWPLVESPSEDDEIESDATPVIVVGAPWLVLGAPVCSLCG